MKNRFEKIYFSKNQIENKIKEISKKINKFYSEKDKIVAIGILKGCYPFLTDLTRNLNLDLQIDHIIASSYKGKTESSNEVEITKDIEINIENKHVIIIEDIIDSGITLDFVIKELKQRKPKDIKIVTLFDKKNQRKKDINVDWTGFEAPDDFLVGYGLDYNEKYRNIDFVGKLKKE